MDLMISLGKKNTLAEYMILSGADNHPPMLDKDLYDSWKSRMELYMQNREHGRMILESVKNAPLIWPTVKENGVIRTKKYVELFVAEKIQADCDMKATNINLQGLPGDIYSLVNHHRVAKDLWERVQLLMQGTSLTKQERECKLYDAFDKFTHIKGESIHTLPPEWSKFMTDVKLVKYLHTSNFDQLHAYLEQHELHANEVHIMRERNQDPLAFVANQQMTPPHFNTYQSSYNNPQLQQQFSPSHHASIQPNQHYSSHYPSQTQFNHSSIPLSHTYQSQINHQTLTVPQMDSSLAVLVFKQGDDPSDAINKMMGDKFLMLLELQEQELILQEGHMARHCLKPKRKRDATWFREKVLLVKAQGNGKVLIEEELEFLADPSIAEGLVTQSVITYNTTYQADDLDAYDSDCDEISTAKAVLMANLFSYGLDFLSKVQIFDNTYNDMLNQSGQEMSYSEPSHFVEHSENEIHSDSNIIP
ncbi:hypothetical protein Tco_0902608 [Tanacetum coccineum]